MELPGLLACHPAAVMAWFVCWEGHPWVVWLASSGLLCQFPFLLGEGLASPSQPWRDRSTWAASFSSMQREGGRSSAHQWLKLPWWLGSVCLWVYLEHLNVTVKDIEHGFCGLQRGSDFTQICLGGVVFFSQLFSLILGIGEVFTFRLQITKSLGLVPWGWLA